MTHALKERQQSCLEDKYDRIVAKRNKKCLFHLCCTCQIIFEPKCIMQLQRVIIHSVPFPIWTPPAQAHIENEWRGGRLTTICSALVHQPLSFLHDWRALIISRKKDEFDRMFWMRRIEAERVPTWFRQWICRHLDCVIDFIIIKRQVHQPSINAWLIYCLSWHFQKLALDSRKYCVSHS